MPEDYDDNPSERAPITGVVRIEAAPEPRTIWTFQRRYLVAFMAFLGFCNVYTMRVNMSVAIIAMTSNSTYIDPNGTAVTIPAEFDWDSNVQGLILSSFFYGYIVSQIPAGVLAAKYGGRRIFGIGIAATSVLTVLTPVFARTSLYLLIAVRVIEGIFEGVTYPAIHALWSHWAPPLERSKLAAAAFSGSYFGTVIALPISGILPELLGWPYIFIVFGVIAFVWSIFWCLVIAETPSTDKNISDNELNFIVASLGSGANHIEHRDIPWKRIFMSFPVWAIIIAHFSGNWGFYTLLTELPTFMKDVVKIDVNEVGALAACPYLAMGIMVQVGGHLADYLRANGSLTTVRVRKIFNCSGFVFQTIFLLVAAYMKNATLLILCVTASIGFGGIAWCGFGVNHLDIAPPYASVLMGVSNTFGTLPGMISPIVTGHLVENKTPEEWQIVFYIAAGAYLIGAIFYGIFASGEEQSWAQNSSELLRDESSVAEDPYCDEANCE